MPDLLWLYLASGHCGDSEVELPEAVAALVASGAIDRETLVETVLVALTAGQRPVAQRTLAKILAEIGLQPAEVTGGLAYLLGVLAAADRSVPPVLLPITLDLIIDGEGLRSVTDVIASRPEKKPREQLLSALRGHELRDRAGAQAVAEVLDVLAATDDGAYVAKVDSLRSKLGLKTSQQAHDEARLGLWDLDPSPSGTAYTDLGWSIDDYWLGAVEARWADVRHSSATEVVDRELHVMEQGTYDASRMVRAVQAQLDAGSCHAGGLGAALEELFLRGGLRQGFDAALASADLCAGAARRPTGLPELLRILGRYAGEAPHPSAVPPSIGALAADGSSSKSSTEARRLVARLTGEDERTAVARLSGPDSTPAAPEPRGLWGLMTDETSPLPADRRAPRIADTMEELQRLAHVHWGRRANPLADVDSDRRRSGPVTGPVTASRVGLVDSEVLLSTVLACVERYGVDTVRSTLHAVERTGRPADEIVCAIECWLDGALDLTTFWRLATTQVESDMQVWQRWREEMVVRDVRAWRKGQRSFSERLRLPDDPEAEVLVVPYEIGTPGQRFLFLRAAEALLRAEEPPVLLGLPSWRDSTLDLDELLTRLRKLADDADGSGAAVGPLDLVVALHRLRPVHPTRADEVPEGLSTDARFTDPLGREAWDATALVRRWIVAGGLPPLGPEARAGMWTGAPQTPVPYPSLAAWPAELADDPWSPILMPYDDLSKFRMEAVLRLYPRWSDRSFPYAYLSGWSGEMPTLAAGPLGVAVHDVLLSRLTPAGAMNGTPRPESFVEQVRRGRIDPAAAAAAAVGRHEAGTLGLAGLTRTLDQQMENNLRGLWPVTLAIADALCTVPRRPSALAGLLTTLTSYAHEVPASARSDVPAGVAFLAGSKGSTKAHRAARDLVAMLEQKAAG